MSNNQLPTLASYVPPAVAQSIYHSPTVPQAPSVHNFDAAVLFADVSGFTPLAEGLAQKGPQGAEELTRILNRYFRRMITLVEAEGGQVVKFSGDAMMVVFPAQPGKLGRVARRAEQAAGAMQHAMGEFSTLQTIAGTIELGMKIGVGCGQVCAFSVGGEQNKWEYVVAGDPLRQVAEAEHAAGRGEIIFSPQARATISPGALPPLAGSKINWDTLSAARQTAAESALRAYIPDIITSRLAAGQSDWLAELRRLTVLFVSVVEGLDYTQPNAMEQLQTFTRTAQATFLRYEGSINKIAVDDKGTILIGLFGAPPFAHEDDPERAAHCALELQKTAQAQNLTLSIGVTTGQVFAGPVGSQTRREYTVMGDTVNLAARLMSVAQKEIGQHPAENGIRCDHETYRAVGGRLTFDALAPVQVKGKAGLIKVYRPLGAGAARRGRTGRPLSKFVGRVAEMAQLNRLLTEVTAPVETTQAGDPDAPLLQSAAKRNRVVLVEGEAGIGKSRLVQEMGLIAQEQRIVRLAGAGLSIEQNTAYRAWRDIFSAFFQLDDIDTQNQPERQQRVRQQIKAAAPNLIERTPLLNDILGLGLPETDLTQNLDPKLRHESLISFLIDLLRTRTGDDPLVITLEDAHWLDSASWELLLEIARGLEDCPLLLIIALRPLRGDRKRAEYTRLAELPQTTKIALKGLSSAEITDLVAARLEVDSLPPEVGRLAQTRSEGNPFFAEELAHTLRDSDVLTIEQVNGKARCIVSGDLNRLALPDTVQGLVLSRLDRLPPEEYLTMKVASVIGRSFTYLILRAVYPTQITDPLLQAYLDDLARLDLTPMQTPETAAVAGGTSAEAAYFFKHIITQEVAYETLLFSQRRQLHHTVAAWHEEVYGAKSKPGTALAPYYPLLVYHYRRAEEPDRERRYCRLAGEQLAAQFANSDAVGYFSRAIELLGASDLSHIGSILANLNRPELQRQLFELLAAREIVYDRLGKRDLQAADLDAMLAIAEAWNDDLHRANVYNRLSLYYENTGDYPAAQSAAEAGLNAAKKLKTRAVEGESLNRLATIAWKQGSYQTAQQYGEQALAVLQQTAEQRGEADSLKVLGNISYELGDSKAAQAYHRQALNIQRAIGDRFGEAASLLNLGNPLYAQGDVLTARDYYERALTILRTIGYRRGMAYALGSLGRVYQDLGDYVAAKSQYSQALSILHVIGDRWGEAIGLHNISLVYHALEQHKVARAHCEQALVIQRELGDRRGEGFSLTYLGLALEGLQAWPEAAETYRQALALRREIGQQAMSVENVAALARVALAQNNIAQAAEYAAEVLAWIETSGAVGIENPALVYHTLYRVLAAEGKPQQARDMLAQAHTLLTDRAAKITDEQWRNSFLTRVPLNRKIIAAWEQNNSAAA